MNSTTESLWVIMPVYNEEISIMKVIDEWAPVLRGLQIHFTLLTINDGSKDKTLEILTAAKERVPELKIIDKANSGHGQSCVLGYREAVNSGATYVFQIDSDGQCDPKYFPSVWEKRSTLHSVFGRRISRDDGAFRMFASRIVSLVTWLATGTWVADANVPYRLVPTSILNKVVAAVPNDIYLANILVSVLVKRTAPIHWVPIHFRDRFGGSPSVKPGSFYKQGKLLFHQLRAAVGLAPKDLQRHLA